MIYVHIPRTGGTSVGHALTIPVPHACIEYYKQSEPERFENEPSAAFIRHPLDHLESWYFWAEYKYYQTFEDWGMAGFPTQWWMAQYAVKGFPHGYPCPIMQEQWIEINGKCAITHLMRLENAQEDFKKMCIEGLKIEPPRLLKYNANNRRTREIVTWTPALLEKAKGAVGLFAEKYGYELTAEAVS